MRHGRRFHLGWDAAAVVTIENANLLDASLIQALKANPYTASWTKEDFARWLQQSGIVALKTMADTQLAGYLLISTTPPQADILDFAVSPAYRRQGIGAALLKYSLIKLAELGVNELWGEVATGNHAAWQLYQNYGAVAHTIRRNYYHLGDQKQDAQLFCIKVN